MKFLYFARVAFILAVVLALSQEIKAQYAYGVSDIIYDKTTKRVTSYSETSLDPVAGLYYDPAVIGGMFKEGTLIAGPYRDNGLADIFAAEVIIQTLSAASPNTRYDVISDHYVTAFFSYTPINFNDDGTPGPLAATKWYDPLGFSTYGGGKEPGWSSFQGSTSRESVSDVQYFYLGTTGKGVVTDPPPCQSTAMADSSGSCPDKLTVQITNKYKADPDLSGTTQNALLGAAIPLRATTNANSTDPVTYTWKVDNKADATTASYDTYFDGLGAHTISLDVTQGQQTVSKSFQINVSLPQLKEDLVQNVKGGFSGVERPPNITTSNDPCGFAVTPPQRLILGCLRQFPITDRRSTDIAGLYLKTIAAPPPDFISIGNQSYVEFLQIVKPSIKRYKGNNNQFTECASFTSTDTNGWRQDFNGRDYPLDGFHGYKYRSNFTNNPPAGKANVSLDFIDAPYIILFDKNSNNQVINSYALDEQFETYVTYYADSFPNVPLGTDFRHALAVVKWNWKANAKKSGSSWVFNGIKSPSTIIDLISTLTPYAANSSGETQYSGRFSQDLDISIEPQGYKTCDAHSPITTTTKRNVAVWRKNNGYWYVMNSDGSVQASTQWGVDYDIPVPGDYDGDGLADFAVYRPDNPATPEDECINGCFWYVLRSSDGTLQALQLGSKEDKPVPADYDGDGKTDMAVFRPSSASWYAIKSTDGSLYAKQFGATGDVPVPSDYDGDGFDDVAVWSPSVAAWKILNSSNQTITTQAWGYATDKPVIGDYDGDGKTDIANWQSNGNWHILLSSTGQTRDVSFGAPATDTPVPGDYDGDGRTDIAVFRPNGTQPAQWYILNSSNNQMQVQLFGTNGDLPIPAAYRR